MTPGTRVRVVGGPWPERIGCEGVTVAPPRDGTYPQPATTETIVLLDHDPVVRSTAFGRSTDDRDRGWSCVMATRDLAEVDR